jgi:hypothetical protein
MFCDQELAHNAFKMESLTVCSGENP